MAKRTTNDRARTQALDRALRGMFGKLRKRPVSDHLISIVDQLDAADRSPVIKKAG